MGIERMVSLDLSILEELLNLGDYGKGNFVRSVKTYGQADRSMDPWIIQLHRASTFLQDARCKSTSSG
jgi:hypothetical protein